MQKQIVKIGKQQKLESNNFEKIGYEFEGWGIKADGEAIYKNEEEIKDLSTKSGEIIELFAIWKLPPLKIGDNVEYSSNGSYLWQGKYYSSSGDSNINLNSSAGNPFHINEWRILNIEDNGQIEMVAKAPTSGKVKLVGAQGYNNGVLLLNQACQYLYGNSEKGITARSIKFKDLNDRFINPVGIYYSPTTLTGTTLYPTIFAKEYGSVISGKSNSTQLLYDVQETFIEPSQDGATNGILSATSMTGCAKGTSWIETTSFPKFKEEIYEDIFNVDEANFFLASRTYTSSQTGIWGISTCNSKSITLNKNKLRFGSGWGGNFTCEEAILPIINVDSNHIKRKEGTTNWIIE